MDYNEIVERLNKMGLTNGSTIGLHLGICDIAADAIKELILKLDEMKRERDDAVHDRMMMEQRIGELIARAEVAEKRAEKVENTISDIKEALKFGRYSAAMLRCLKWKK